MKNISFANPYLLLVAIPLLALTFVPYFWAIKKENKSVGSTVSLILHVLIVLLVTLGLAGTTHTTVMTETEVYVLADVSYSDARSLDEIDAYIASLEDKLPEKSKVGIIAFGKDYELLTPLGGERVSVGHSRVDQSATNISAALDYASTLFSDDAVKRIVLISDGKQSQNVEEGSFARSISELYAKNVFIDAVYINNNVDDSTPEIQISDVEFVPATYLGNATELTVAIESGISCDAIVTLLRDGERVESAPVHLDGGYNVVSFSLSADTVGEFDYTVTFTSDVGTDTSPYNNEYRFTQSVHENLYVLLVSDSAADADYFREKYPENTVVDAYSSKDNIPITVEALACYDEIILSNIDLRSLESAEAFVNALDVVVSRFGKSLFTNGDLKIQNRTDDNLSALENMLPIKLGNDAKDATLYCLVLDCSYSMDTAGRLRVMKDTATKLLSLMSPSDSVAVVGFDGSGYIVHITADMSFAGAIAEAIEGVEPSQSTSIGAGLFTAKGEVIEKASSVYSSMQVLLISDGITDSSEKDNPVTLAEEMLALGATTSCINVFRTEGEYKLSQIATAGGGNYYFIKNEDSVDKTIFESMAGELTQTVIDEISPVTVYNKRHETTLGISSLPDVGGFVFSKAKATATTVLTTSYVKDSGASAVAPLYVHWDYGNGKVASFTSDLTGAWGESFTGDAVDAFTAAMCSSLQPSERVDYPFTVDVSYDGVSADVSILPVTPRYDAILTLTVVTPDGEEYTEVLPFEKTGYLYSLPTQTLGKYSLHISYDVKYQSTFTAQTSFNLSYSPEYDAFDTFSPAYLNTSIGSKGTVHEGELPVLENDRSRVATYELDFSLPFMIAAIALYIIDIVMRKLRLADIKSFFGKKRAKGGMA